MKRRRLWRARESFRDSEARYRSVITAGIAGLGAREVVETRRLSGRLEPSESSSIHS